MTYVSTCFLLFVWQDEQEIKRRIASTDAKEIQKFYEQYCREHLKGDHARRKP
jgi:hypothetical protein